MKESHQRIVTQIEIQNQSISELSQSNITTSMGLIISEYERGHALIPPQELRTMMVEEFETNQFTFVPDDLRFKPKEEHFGMKCLTPVFLTNYNSKISLNFLHSCGFLFESGVVSTSGFLTLSTVWAPIPVISDNVEVDLDDKERKFLLKIVRNAHKYASRKKCWMHLGITLGWSVKSYLGDLEFFTESQIAKNGRISWERTAACNRQT